MTAGLYNYTKVTLTLRDEWGQILQNYDCIIFGKCTQMWLWFRKLSTNN